VEKSSKEQAIKMTKERVDRHKISTSGRKQKNEDVVR